MIHEKMWNCMNCRTLHQPFTIWELKFWYILNDTAVSISILPLRSHSSRHVRQRIPRKPAPDTPLICLLLEALGLRGEAGPFDWLRTSGVTLWPGDLVCPQILMTFRVNALSFRASDLDSNQRQQEIRLLVLYLPWCNLLFACQYGFNIYLGSDSFWFIARATSEPASLAQRGFQLEVWDFCWGTVGIFNFGKPVKFPCRIYHWNTSSYVDLS